MKEKRKDMLYEAVEKNNIYGYYELRSQYRKIMQDFYRNEYYQEDYAAFSHTDYDELDLHHKQVFYSLKLHLLKKWRCQKSPTSMLDIGSGEGYALAFFKEHHWNVTGIDLSAYGMRQHNPDMEQYFIQGSFETVIERLAIERKTYDFINADNVLEHVPNPEKFFRQISGVCHKDSIVCVTVPNDFSLLQQIAYDMGRIDDAFWVTKETSEHFSYFSLESLTALGNAMGYQRIASLADWPIDFFLLHPATNYRNVSGIGHDCHVACTRFENELFEKDIDKTIQLFQAMAEAGIGREISVYFKLRGEENCS